LAQGEKISRLAHLGQTLAPDSDVLANISSRDISHHFACIAHEFQSSFDHVQTKSHRFSGRLDWSAKPRYGRGFADSGGSLLSCLGRL